jgi:hypothetical protein
MVEDAPQCDTQGSEASLASFEDTRMIFRAIFPVEPRMREEVDDLSDTVAGDMPYDQRILKAQFSGQLPAHAIAHTNSI